MVAGGFYGCDLFIENLGYTYEQPTVAPQILG
jgi:hypothetical protein